MIVVDSSVWIDYFNGRETAAVGFLDRLPVRQLLVGDLVLVEVLQGFRFDESVRAAEELFGKLEFAAMGGREIAIAAARNHRLLRQRGVTVRKTIDTLIATFCLMKGHQLLHNDRDFESFRMYLGLMVVTA